MQLNDEDIREFTALYTQEFGETISEVEAREMGSRVLDLYTILMRPLPHELNTPATPLSEIDTLGHVSPEGVL